MAVAGEVVVIVLDTGPSGGTGGNSKSVGTHAQDL